MWVLVGLGNPGKRYQATRHNVGYQVLNVLRKKFPVQETYRRKYFCGWKLAAEENLVLIRPRTFMNESGRAVKSALEFLQAGAPDLLVVHDDIAIPLGEIKITRKKGPGGHKGVLSIISELGTKDFLRVRIGIGKDQIPVPFLDYVLSEFSREEAAAVDRAIENAGAACLDLVRLGPEKAMTKWNT